MKRVFFYLLLLQSNLIWAEEFNIVCEGYNYSKSNLAPKEMLDGKDTRTYLIAGDTLKGFNCPVNLQNKILCSSTFQVPDGAFSTKLDWYLELDRVSGYVQDQTVSSSPGAAVIARMPEAAQYLSPADTLVNWKIFRGHCKKVSKNKF